MHYAHGGRAAIQDISVNVLPGEFVVLLGPSGCGKSTLLRTVNRMVEPSSGTVFIDGASVLETDPVVLRRSIGYVIQAVGLFSHMTIAQNISVVPDLLGWERARTQERVEELMELVHLPLEYRDRYPAQLSGGEQQRAGVARAIAAQPRVLLMDEPFGAVDAIVRASLQEEMRDIVRRLHTTILFVTHDVDEALRLADRLVIMNGGHIIQVGTPLELMTKPADDFVRELLGANDLTRRLQLLSVRSAMREGRAENAPEISANDTLADALLQFLGGIPALNVRADDGAAGTLTFADVVSALRA